MFENLTDSSLWAEYSLKMLIAAVLSGIIGLERSLSEKTAGMRTHMLVCIGTLMFTLTGIEMLGDGGDIFNANSLRILQAIIGGLGFLGGGAIIQAKGSVKGLATATSIWTMGALGVAIAVGNYVIAILFVSMSFFVLIAIDRFEHKAGEYNGKEKSGSE